LKSYLLIFLSVCLMGIAPFSSVIAQDTENKDAPEILTTDLVRRQKVDASMLDVSFVIYDDDDIVEVSINGEKQNLVRANTLTINKTLNFVRGKNVITIIAKDDKGNQRVKNYLVAYGVEIEEAEAQAQEGSKAKEDPKRSWKIVGDIQYNSDSNPNNDLGLPIDTGDYTLEGQIADDDQADNQTVVNLLGMMNFGKIGAVVGYSQGSYSKEIYEPLKSSVLIAGATYVPQANEDGLAAKYTFLDISMGTEAFAQYHVINLGYQFGRQDKEDGTTRHLFGLIYNHKMFADSDLEAGNSNLLGWEYTNLDAEKLDFFKSVIAYGTGSDGSEASEYAAFAMDFDWSNKWESGLLQGTGLGFHYKEFPNQEPLSSDFGDSRIDIPIRFSFNLGWAFNDDWSLKYNYDYKINVSTKSPSYKIVNGLQLKGGF
jgi:hypothetical protein